MFGHIRANLWLLGLTLLLCCVLYPLALLGIAQIPPFREKAEGSLIRDDKEDVIGSRLIAQPFKGDEYFQPRPSAVLYNAAASGASNWGASQPLLRDRVAQKLGPIVRYDDGPGKKGPLVGPDIEEWFQKQTPDFVGGWAQRHPALAEQWIKDHSASAASFLDMKEDDVKNDSAESSQKFFEKFSREHPGMWPEDNQKENKINPTNMGDDVRAYLFDPWLQAGGPKREMEKVPADMVMASGSGLDPHITLENARMQLKNRVAAAQADRIVKQLGVDPMVKAKTDAKVKVTDAEREKMAEQVRKELNDRLPKPLEETIREAIEKLLDEKKESPLGGLVGVPLVNVLEVNQELTKRVDSLVAAK